MERVSFDFQCNKSDRKKKGKIVDSFFNNYNNNHRVPLGSCRRLTKEFPSCRKLEVGQELLSEEIRIIKGFPFVIIIFKNRKVIKRE